MYKYNVKCDTLPHGEVWPAPLRAIPRTDDAADAALRADTRIVCVRAQVSAIMLEVQEPGAEYPVHQALIYYNYN